jgi:hypothetical protein
MMIGAHPVKFKVGAVHAGRMASLARRRSSLRRVLNTLSFTIGAHDPPSLSQNQLLGVTGSAAQGNGG